MIIDESTLRKINRLTLIARQVRAGVMKGERRSVKRGTSLEFADYRNYTPGDDLRRLDWRVYGRLDRPFLKLFEEEEDLAVHILVDVSQSMDWGEGDGHKLRYAARLTGALGAIALSNGDRLTLTPLQQKNSTPSQPFGPARGQVNLMAMLRFCEGLQAGGQTDLTYSLRDYGLKAQRPGLAYLISDLFSTTPVQDGLAQLQGRGYEVTVLHLLAPEEIEPPIAGDLQLVDVETGQLVEVSVDAGMRRLFQERVEGWRAEIGAFCRQRGAHYLPITTAQPWDEVILQEMRQTGMVR